MKMSSARPPVVTTLNVTEPIVAEKVGIYLVMTRINNLGMAKRPRRFSLPKSENFAGAAAFEVKGQDPE